MITSRGVSGGTVITWTWFTTKGCLTAKPFGLEYARPAVNPLRMAWSAASLLTGENRELAGESLGAKKPRTPSSGRVMSPIRAKILGTGGGVAMGGGPSAT